MSSSSSSSGGNAFAAATARFHEQQSHFITSMHLSALLLQSWSSPDYWQNADHYWQRVKHLLATDALDLLAPLPSPLERHATLLHLLLRRCAGAQHNPEALAVVTASVHRVLHSMGHMPPDFGGLKDGQGWTVLQRLAPWAAMDSLAESSGTASIHLMQHLIQRGGDINAVAPDRKTPLLMCMDGDAACVRLLLQLGATIEIPDERGDTMLHYIAQQASAWGVYVELFAGDALVDLEYLITQPNLSRAIPLELAQHRNNEGAVHHTLWLLMHARIHVAHARRTALLVALNEFTPLIPNLATIVINHVTAPLDNQ